ncbi:hypothetical protein BH11MYX2_BH11MYX2_02440 [soil metagenome]
MERKHDALSFSIVNNCNRKIDVASEPRFYARGDCQSSDERE